VAFDFGHLKHRVVSGVFFTASAQVLRQLVQLGAVALLARLLEPGAFGLLALAAAILAFLQLLADLGLGASVERRQALTPAEESTLLLLNLGGAGGLCLLLWVAAPALGRLFGQPDLSWVLSTLGPCFLLAGALRTRNASLVRAMRFRAVAFIEFASVLCGALASVTLALLGAGMTALVAGSAVQQLAWAGATVAIAGLPGPLIFRRALAREHLGFGSTLTAFNVLNFFTRKLDDLLVGGLMGTAALGLYEKSYALMMLPVSQLSAVIGRVLYPALAKVKDDPPRFAFLFLGAVRKIAGLAFPLAALCIVAAGPVVRIVLGPRFEGAVPIFAVLSLVMGLQPLTGIGGSVLLARGRVRLHLALGAGSGAVILLAFTGGAMQGTPVAMARWYAAAYALLFLPTMAVTMRVCGLTLKDLLRRIAVPAAAATVAFGAGLLARDLPFVATACAVGAAYSVAHLLLDRTAFLDLFRFVDPRRAFPEFARR